MSLFLGYINRAIKTEVDGVKVYEIRNAGVDTTVVCEDEFEGCKFKVEYIFFLIVFL